MVALTNNPAAAPEPAPILPADFNHTLALAKLNALTIVAALLADAETPQVERRRLAALILRASFLPMPKPLTLAEAMRLETNPDSPWGANADYSDDTAEADDEEPDDNKFANEEPSDDESSAPRHELVDAESANSENTARIVGVNHLERPRENSLNPDDAARREPALPRAPLPAAHPQPQSQPESHPQSCPAGRAGMLELYCLPPIFHNDSRTNYVRDRPK
ncbi:hypothetical protein BH11PLA1_BH11PLA1_20960 [soil metagenome]